jgi:hypothetical protein
MKDEIRPKFDGPLEEIRPDENHPFRRMTDRELKSIISEKASLEKALHDNPCHDKLLANLRRTRQEAEAILNGRKGKKIPEL